MQHTELEYQTKEIPDPEGEGTLEKVLRDHPKSQGKLVEEGCYEDRGSSYSWGGNFMCIRSLLLLVKNISTIHMA